MTPSPVARPAIRLTTGTLALAVLLACTADSMTGLGPDDTPFQGDLRVEHAPLRAFTNVHLVNPESGTVEDDGVLIVRGGMIEAVGPAAEVAVPADAEVVDGEGGSLMPGLVDMHVHMSAGDTEAYIRSGITTVRNMWGFQALGAIIEDIDAGRRIGPTIHTLSPGLDGPPVHWPETQLITDPAKADSVVQLMWDRGYRELKMYQDLRLDVYDAIVAAAEARGMTFAGHKPGPVPLTHVIEAGQRSIEHLGGYQITYGAALDQAIQLTVEHGTWNCPTLEIQTHLAAASQAAPYRRTVVKALYDAGARILVGTDSGIGVTEPGTSLADEMAELMDAGIPLPALVRMATVDAAEYLGESDRIGRLVAGMRADLVLLSGNPLEDLDALRRPLGVELGDGWVEMR